MTEGEKQVSEKSKNNIENRSLITCLRKKKYRQENLALDLIKRIKEERGEILYHYFCPVCSNYHLTKNKHHAGRKGAETEDREAGENNG